MKRKEFKKAIKSATPLESLYALLSERQKENSNSLPPDSDLPKSR